jgi:hypothetical protein
MAKMFYTLDEAKTALGKSEEDIKQLAREGRLREFRDGPRLMFKADQVEALRAELSGTGETVDLGPSDSGMAIGLADSRGIGSGLSGSGLGSAGSGSGLGMDDGGRSPGGAGMTLKEDTALAADLGLSGSVSGVPSPGRPPGSGTGLAGSQGSRAGIDVFQSDEVERVDPSAQTAISSGISESSSVEGVGSGSGLLDLTRESDDTSLGAELLDEIAPGGGGTAVGRRVTAEGGGAGGSGLVEIRGHMGASSRVVGAGPIIYQERPDPMAPAFGAAALAASIVVIFGAFALITGVVDTAPTILTEVAQKGFLIVAGGGLAVSLVFFVVGLVLGKSTTR